MTHARAVAEAAERGDERLWVGVVMGSAASENVTPAGSAETVARVG